MRSLAKAITCIGLFIYPTLISAQNPIESSSLKKTRTGRLLVNIEETSSFSTEKFATAIGAKIIQIDKRNPFKDFPLNFLDYELVTISPSAEKNVLLELASQFGYRLLSLSEETLQEAIDKTLSVLENTPKYSSELSYMSNEELEKLYSLMEKVDLVFKKHNITYWATGGTLLGAIRYQGIMPWDDDLDICILDTDEEKLKNIKQDLDSLGLSIFKKDIYKRSFKDGTPIYKGNALRQYTYPFLDIFIMSLEKKRESKDLYTHKAPYFYCKYGSEDAFTYSQISNISYLPFGPLMIPVAHGAEDFLNRNYGTPNYPNLWKFYAKEGSYSHKLERPSSTMGSAFVLIDSFSIDD